MTRRKPTVDLALSLLSGDQNAKLTNRARFAVGAPLLHSGLLHFIPDPTQTEQPLLVQYLKLDEAAVRLLIGHDGA